MNPELVLNVDDYGPGRYAKTALLRRAGFAVAEAATGADALRLAAQRSPGVVLLDVNLPDMSGFEVCRRLKATASLPVIQISATFTAPTDAAKGLDGGADAYLVEPVEPPVLIATVNALLRLRRAEEAATAAARHWQTTFDAIQDGVALLDAEGHVVRCNLAFRWMFGESAAAGEKPPRWRLPAAQSGELPFARMRRTGRREMAEVSLGPRWYRVTAEPLIDDGVVHGAVYVVADITDWKAAEIERVELLAREQAARAQAETANQAKDEFVALVSHELRTPLTPIVGWTSTLRRKRPEVMTDPLLGPALDTIDRNARQLGRLIDDLLDLSRIATGKFSLDRVPVDLRPVAVAAVEAIRPAADAKHLWLEIALGDAPAITLGDPDRLQQVVANLLSNAVKFTPAAGRIEVRLSRDGRDAVLTVADSGLGIAPDLLPHVFDRFRQGEPGTPAAHRGLGLGLAIVHHLVELHGGTVAAASDGGGRGATFTVRLPLVETPEAVTGRADGDGERGQPLRDVRVLLVEDDEDTRSFLVLALRGAGATVRAAGSAVDALRALPHFDADVVVADIRMPGKNGYELLREVRAAGSHVPAVALTASTADHDRHVALAAGFDVHVAKPVDFDLLFQEIARLAGRPSPDREGTPAPEAKPRPG